MALACDLIVASTTATFGIPEVKSAAWWRQAAVFSVCPELPFNVAMELALTGDPIDAARAHHFGLVNQLCEPGEALGTARELAGRIEASAPAGRSGVALGDAGGDHRGRGHRLASVRPRPWAGSCAARISRRA